MLSSVRLFSCDTSPLPCSAMFSEAVKIWSHPDCAAELSEVWLHPILRLLWGAVSTCLGYCRISHIPNSTCQIWWMDASAAGYKDVLCGHLPVSKLFWTPCWSFFWIRPLVLGTGALCCGRSQFPTFLKILILIFFWDRRPKPTLSAALALFFPWISALLWRAVIFRFGVY